jgi:stage II sporulation protein D
MPGAAAIISLLCFAAVWAESPARPVRIGLFSLFKPSTLHVGTAPGSSAHLTAGRLTDILIEPGQTIRIHSSGRRLTVTLVDSYGRVRLTTTASEAEVATEGSGVLELSLPGRIKRPVRGSLSVRAVAGGDSGSLRIVLGTERESAVASIVAAEMAGEREAEAIKALAIVVRTFVLSHEGRHRTEGFDFCDTTHCQLYRGEADLSVEGHSPLVANAVAATEGNFLAFRNIPVEGHYTAACGGLSISPEMVWGGKVASGYPYRRISCDWCQASKYSRWERTANADAIFAALSGGPTGTRISHAAELAVQLVKSGDVVRSVVVRDRGRRFEFGADDFRRRIGRQLGWNTVLSPTFSVERRGQRMVFRGRGFGSQAGLCVAGAFAQASAGRNWRDILNFYYPGTEIVRSA